MRLRVSSSRRRAGARLLRRGPRRAGVPRGRGAARARALRRARARRRHAQALCHLGTNVVPSGEGCDGFAELRGAGGPRMLIGEDGAPSPSSGRRRAGGCRVRGTTGSGSRCTSRRHRPRPAVPACGTRRAADLDGSSPPARRRTGRSSASIRCGATRTASAGGRGPDRGGALLALARGRRDPLQGRGVGLDARGDSAPAGLGRSPARAARPRDARATRPARAAACRAVPAVCLFVRAENGARAPALRDRRHAARARLPQRAALRHVKRLLLVRHAHARSNADAGSTRRRPGRGSPSGESGRRSRSREALACEPLELGVATRLARTQETPELALGGRDVPRLVLPELDEIGVGPYEGGPLPRIATGRGRTGRELACPGGGESRAHAADAVRARARHAARAPRSVVLAVSHSLPLRYVLDAADGAFPASRVEPVAARRAARARRRRRRGRRRALRAGRPPASPDRRARRRRLGRALGDLAAHSSHALPPGLAARLAARRPHAGPAH